jgi:hypothetical protein
VCYKALSLANKINKASKLNLVEEADCPAVLISIVKGQRGLLTSLHLS